MNVPMSFLLLVFLLPSQGKSEVAATAVKGKFETLTTFEVERKPNELGGLGSAIDVADDGKGLVYLSDALHRLDLDTGQDQILASTEDLKKAGVEGERSQLFRTADPNRFIFVSGGAWNCPWPVFLINVSPVSAKLLTEQACGDIATSPSKTRLAVQTSETCEGRGCGQQRLLLFSTASARPLFDGVCPPDTADMRCPSDVPPLQCRASIQDVSWEDDGHVTVRYTKYFEKEPHRSEDRIVSLRAAGEQWVWGESRKAEKSRERDIEVDHGGVISLKSRPGRPELLRLNVADVFGELAPEYRADTPRVFRAGDRIVIVRRLFEKQPASGVNPRRREQIAVLKLREAR